MTIRNQEKLAKTKASYKVFHDNFEKLYDSFDQSIHQAVSPNKMPPNFNDELKSLGMKTDQPEPTLVDVCSRDIISLQIDHKNERVT